MNIDILEKMAEFIEKDTQLAPVAVFRNKKATPYQIIWRGNAIKFLNGKSVWPSIGAAKNALRGKIRVRKMVEALYPNIPDHAFAPSTYGKYITSQFSDSAYQEILFKLQEAKILEFRPLPPS